jgi:hypothetical protein
MTPRWDETWQRVRDWTDGQARAERLAVQVLLADGFTAPDPSHPLGGADGGADALLNRDGAAWVMAAYFPRGQQTFATVRAKVRADLEGASRNDADGMAFVTNQELRRAEREALAALGDVPIDLYHLERVVAILDRPELYGVRDQFLEIPPPGGRLRDVTTGMGDGRPSLVPHLVPREALWEEAARREVPGQPLALYGDAGNGKTQLALALAAVRAGQRPIALIRAGRRNFPGAGVYEFDLMSTLLRAGYDAEQWTEPALELGVRELLGRDDGPAAVIDDVPLADLVRLVPERCAVPVYITSRVRLPIGRPLHVACFDQDQAVDAASRILPAADEGDLRHLCELVGMSPQAINVACRVVRRGSVSLAELIEGLQAEPARTLEDLEAIVGEREVPGTPGLVGVHRELLRQVAGIRDGLTTLRRLAWFTGDPVGVQTAYALAGPAGGVAAGLHFDGVLTQLAALGAVLHEDGVVAMNDLSRTILRSLTLQALDQEVERFIERLHEAAPAELWAAPAPDVAGGPWGEGRFERSFLGLELALMERHLSAFAGRPAFRFLCLDMTTWLLHQTGAAVFNARAAGTSAILEATSQSLLLWIGDHAARRECTDQEALQILDLMRLCQKIYGTYYDAMLPAGQVPEGQDDASEDPYAVPWPWLAPETGRARHRFLGICPETVRNHGASALTSCGRLIVPAGEEDELPDCEECQAERSAYRSAGMLRWVTTMRGLVPRLGAERRDLLAMFDLLGAVLESETGDPSGAARTRFMAARSLLASAQERPLSDLEREAMALFVTEVERSLDPSDLLSEAGKEAWPAIARELSSGFATIAAQLLLRAATTHAREEGALRARALLDEADAIIQNGGEAIGVDALIARKDAARALGLGDEQIASIDTALRAARDSGDAELVETLKLYREAIVKEFERED